jgi:hypothetical protein
MESAFVVHPQKRGAFSKTVRSREVLKRFEAVLKQLRVKYTVEEHPLSAFGQLPCASHVEHLPTLTYSDFEKDAARRTTMGQTQKFCDQCGFYVWVDAQGKEVRD